MGNGSTRAERETREKAEPLDAKFVKWLEDQVSSLPTLLAGQYWRVLLQHYCYTQYFIVIKPSKSYDAIIEKFMVFISSHNCMFFMLGATV